MATGPSEASLAEGASESLADLIASDDPVTIVAAPAVRQLVAAAVLAAAVDVPHVRVLGPDRPPVSAPAGPVVTTAPGLVDADTALSPYTPLADLDEVLDAADTSPTIAATFDAVQRAGTDPQPGVVSTHDDLPTALEHSIRLGTTEVDDLPASIRDPPCGSDGAQAAASWLAADVAATNSPAAAAAAATAFGPTPVSDGPAPTAEGIIDLLTTAAEAAPGVVVSTLVTGTSWTPVIEAYEVSVGAITEAISAWSTGTDEEVALTPVEGLPTVASARCWAASGLEAPYGAVVAGSEPSMLALVAPGDRSASAVLETVTGRVGGACWGGPFVAGAVLPTRPSDPRTALMEAL